MRVTHKDVIKMRSTLKLFIRDWAKEVSNYKFINLKYIG